MPSIFSYINKYLLYPLYYSRHGDQRIERLKTLRKNQWLTPEQINSLQLQALIKLLRHAYETVPYYRDIFNRAGMKPGDIKSIQNFRQLPVLTKTDIQQNLEQMRSTNYNTESLIRDSSGGSTGTPTVFYKDMNRHLMRRADQIRHDRWTGWDLGEPFALLWGAQKDLTPLQGFRQKLVTRYVDRCFPMDAFNLTKDKLNSYVSLLESISPSMILGYANVLYIFAKFLQTHYPEHRIRPKGIVSSAETLTKEKQKIIEDTFHCKVLNRYGSREVGLIASECVYQEGLHINADNVYVEILRNNQPVNPGELGDIIVTDLWNFGMPLIRYRMEDMGRLKNGYCSCERGLPLMESVEGRASDFFVARNGTLIHGEYFTHLFYDIPEIKQFQLIQENRTHVTLKLILNDKNYMQQLTTIIDNIKSTLGSDTIVNTELLDNIPPTPSGKHLFTISRVPH